MIDANGEWDGICACGKIAKDGVKCRFGASHRPLPVPWEVKPEPEQERFPWE